MVSVSFTLVKSPGKKLSTEHVSFSLFLKNPRINAHKIGRTVTDHDAERNLKIPSRVTMVWDTG